MAKVNIESLSGQTFFVGIDVHKKSFHVTLRTFDCEMFSQLMLKIASNPTCVFMDKSFSPISDSGVGLFSRSDGRQTAAQDQENHPNEP